jgi:hypothetical protein
MWMEARVLNRGENSATGATWNRGEITVNSAGAAWKREPRKSGIEEIKRELCEGGD